MGTRFKDDKLDLLKHAIIVENIWILNIVFLLNYYKTMRKKENMLLPITAW